MPTITIDTRWDETYGFIGYFDRRDIEQGHGHVYAKGDLHYLIDTYNRCLDDGRGIEAGEIDQIIDAINNDRVKEGVKVKVISTDWDDHYARKS